MRLKTKLTITAITMVLLPLLLTTIAFLVIGGIMNQGSTRNLIADNTRYVKIADNIFDQLRDDTSKDPDIFNDQTYLDNINEQLKSDGGYVIVRQGDDTITYNGSINDDNSLTLILPEYGSSHDQFNGYLFNDEKKLIRQYDFTLSDGTIGSLFIIFTAQALIAPAFFSYMFFAMCFILLLTSLILTAWTRNGIFKPVGELNVAMQKIKDGNFDYRLNDNAEKGEIGEMYRNYEDMRLRLKESAQEKLEHEQQNKELIRNISHDLKTPITTIRGYAEGLMEGVATTPEKQQKYLKTIYNKAIDMNNLINELTLYSSIDNNRIPYNFRKLNVGDYFGDCVEEVGMDMEGRGIKLNYSNLTAPDTIVIADPEQLKRVINNIVSNSVKYMDRTDGKGQIDIRILDEVDSIRVEVEDNGRGIAPKDLGSIFERFYRTDSSRNSKHQGSGIGLSIVKKIIEDHGGYIWATSHEGEGTTMHFVLRKYTEPVTGGTYEQNTDSGR
jgi:signal transduction histidine kinase